MRALTLTLIGLLHLALALAVWRAKPDSRVNRLFALQTLTFAGWTFGNALLQTGMWLDTAKAVTFASASLIPSAFFTFTMYYPDSTPRTAPVWQWAAIVPGGLFAVAALLTDLLVYDVRFVSQELSRRPGPLYPLFTVYFVVVFGAGLVVFARKWRRARERERAQLNYYGLGLLIATLGGLTLSLLVPATTGSSGVSHLGPYFGLPMAALTAHTIIRHRFMDLRIVVHRSLTFAIALILSLVPLAALLLLVTRMDLAEFSRTLPETLLLGAVCLGVALLIPLTREFAEHLLDRYVYRARTNPQQLLRHASSELTRGLDLLRLLDVIVDTIQVGVEPEGVATYLQNEGTLRLSVTRIGLAGGAFSTPPEPAMSIIERAVAQRTPLLRDDLDMPNDLAVREALNAANWALALPLLADERIVGLIAVGPKRSGDPFFAEDVDALITLANHAGSAVRNATLYAEVTLANEYVNNIVGAMQNGVVAVDASGAVTLVNPAARQILGLPAEVLSKLDAIPGPLRVILEQVLEDGAQNATREVQLQSKGGCEACVLLCTASPLRDHGGHRAGAVAVFSDLTPLKELASQRARAEDLSKLQRVTQALAHEIGNPLVPIKTLAKLLPTRVGDRRFAEDLSRIVSRELGRIEQLVARLRRVAPNDGLSYARVDLRVPMQHALEVLEAAAADQETQIEIIPDLLPVPVVGDSAELEELFLNLLANALEEVADQPKGSRQIMVSITAETDRAVARIADSGRGIKGDVLDHIFDAFVTTKPRGSGLGLAICRGIAERHHGHLTAANAKGGGAVFTIALPLEPEPGPAAGDATAR